jgi:uncharacterized membrane protein
MDDYHVSSISHDLMPMTMIMMNMMIKHDFFFCCCSWFVFFYFNGEVDVVQICVPF